MGLYFGRSRGNYNAPNPNPYSFRVVRSEKYEKGYIIAEIKYLGCTTFDGLKLLLLQTTKNIKDFEVLDPHFLDDDKHPVIARFQPTLEGWRMARACVKELSTCSN